MKLLLFTALALYAANYVLASEITTKCSGFPFQKCGLGYKQEWRQHPFWLECVCTRTESEAEIKQREKEEKCYEYIEKCYQGGELIRGSRSPCASVRQYCEKENADSFCADLKQRNTIFQCGQADSQDFVQDHKRKCNKAADSCYRKGHRYSNDDPRSESCDDLIRFCPAKDIRTFCDTHTLTNTRRVRKGKFLCDDSVIYQEKSDAGFPDDAEDSRDNTRYSPSL